MKPADDNVPTAGRDDQKPGRGFHALGLERTAKKPQACEPISPIPLLTYEHVKVDSNLATSDRHAPKRWCNETTQRRAIGAASEHPLKEEVQEELVSPPSTGDVDSPRSGNFNAGQLLNFREEAPLSLTGLVGVEGNLWGGPQAATEVCGRHDAGGDGRTRIQFVAREGETLSQILQQVESPASCCRTTASQLMPTC